MPTPNWNMAFFSSYILKLQWKWDQPQFKVHIMMWTAIEKFMPIDEILPFDSFSGVKNHQNVRYYQIFGDILKMSWYYEKHAIFHA